MRQLGYRAFTAVFLLLCLVPSLGMLLPRRSGTGGNEVLSAPPRLLDGEGRANPDYLADWCGYAEDRYFLRQELVTAWSGLNRRVLRTSISEDVILGRDGWLYFGGTLDDYTGASLMTAGEVSAAAHNLALASEYCESQGARFLFTIAPNKNSLYPRHMPDFPIFSPRRNADALAGALEAEGVAYLDLFAAFRAQEEELYFTQDSHWDSKGAALAADEINAALGRASRYFDGPFHPEPVHHSDLYAMLCPAGQWLEADRVYGGGLDFTYEAPIRSENDLNIRTAGGGEGSLLMFRDSFGNLFYPYLADSFAQARFSRSPAYRLDQAATQETDCVVVELVERNLRWLLENVPVMPAPAREVPEDGAFPPEAVPLAVEPAQVLPGYELVSGKLPVPLEEGAALFLASPAGCWEAFLLKDGGFALYAPEGAAKNAQPCVITGGAASPPAGSR